MTWFRSSRLWSRQVKFGLCGFLETMPPRWAGIMRKRWSWSLSRRGREDDPSQSRERLALWQKKELEGLAWEKNPPLMESILRNLVSLPMSGRMPRNMSALAPCWDGACGLPLRVQPCRGEGAPFTQRCWGKGSNGTQDGCGECQRWANSYSNFHLINVSCRRDLLVDLLEPALAREHWKRWEKYTFVW